MNSKQILMVEDDGAIVYGLTEILKEEGFTVIPVCSLKKAMETDKSRFCLVLLDLGLPDGEGWQFLETFSSENVKEIMPPVIILTAREDEADIVKGLDMGADDYVTKPFKTGILLSRIRAVMRRQEKFAGAEQITCGHITLDKKKTTVTAGGERIDLTAVEFRLLEYFLENKNRTLTRNALLARIWDNEGAYVNDNTLTVTIKRLREKLGGEFRHQLKTVRGIGYQMEDYGD